MDTSTTKDKLSRFGRSVALMLNRSMMYQKSHPMVQDSIKEVLSGAELLFFTVSPLVFILNREQFYVDEEPLDPRVNVKRIATMFKNHGIQSVSFESGLTTSELDIFVELFASMSLDTDAEAVKHALYNRGIYNIKVNHVLYKKVTEDDQVISRDALKNVTPSMEDDDSQSRKKFMDTLLETILTDEFANTLNIKSLLANPVMVSKNMIAADKASADQMRQTGQGESTTGDAPGGGGDTSGSPGVGPDSGGAGTGGGPGGSGGGIESDGANIGAGSALGGPGGSGIESDGTNIGAGSGFGGLGSGGGPSAGLGGGGSGSGGPGAGSGGGEQATALQGTATEDAAVHVHASETDPSPGTSAKSETSFGPIPSGGGGGHGPMLLHQLELMQQEVKNHLEGEGEVSLETLANAVFEMKKQLLEDIQTQKALGIAYANESSIVHNINELTDQVLIKLVQEEYQSGKITTQRLAQIILRLIPEAHDLKRLLPEIKTVLLESGMPAEVYLDLVEELKHELQNEDLSRIIEESSESIGVDSEDLIDELKENPGQAAKLIYLASEIRKGAGDESALADILVDYVEQMSSQEANATEDADGDTHLHSVVTNVESTVLRQLGKLDVGNDVLQRMEDRINNRMESIMDRIRAEWLNTQAGIASKEKIKHLTVLQTLEHSVGDDEELDDILKTVRTKVEAGEIEENNFSQIHAEINRQKRKLEEAADSLEIPEGVLSSSELMFILEKEIARAERYDAPFSALAFSFVNAKPKSESLGNLVTADGVMAAALEKLVSTIREVDYIGQIGKNKMVALLPMIDLAAAKKALTRVMSTLHAEPLKVNEVPVQLRVAGVVVQYDTAQKLNAQAFAKQLSNKLMDMVSRLKNIQVLF